MTLASVTDTAIVLSVLALRVTESTETMIRDDAKWNWEKRAYELTCLHCGTAFLAKRSDAKFCGSVCRKATSRRKDQLERAAKNAIAEIAYIRRMAEKYTDLQAAAAVQLEQIERALSVTTAVRTDTRLNVTLARVTEKACVKCGKTALVSPASGLCLDCLKGD